MSSIINELRDDKNYYGSLGKSYLSNSDIGILLTNPRAFRNEREETKAFAEGRLFHQLMLEPDKVKDFPLVDVSTRNTKEYKNYCDEHNLDFVMLKKEVDEIHHLVGVMKGNINFFIDIYSEGNLFEEPMVGEIKGMTWKGKADIVTKDCIIDLKTTSDINKFKRSARLYHYDSQCYIYQQLFGKPLVFYVIDKDTNQLGVFRPTEQFIKGGEAKVEKAIEIYKKYFSEDSTDEISNHYIDETLD